MVKFTQNGCFKKKLENHMNHMFTQFNMICEGISFPSCPFCRQTDASGTLWLLKPQEDTPHINPLSNLRSSTLSSRPLQKPAPLKAGNTALTSSLKKNPDLLKILLPSSSFLLFSSCPFGSRQTDDCWSYLTVLTKPGNYVKRGISQLLRRPERGCLFPAARGTGCRSSLTQPCTSPGCSSRAWTLPCLGQTHTTAHVLIPISTLCGVIPKPNASFLCQIRVAFLFL